MTNRATRWGYAPRSLAALVLGLGLVGCGGQPAVGPDLSEGKPDSNQAAPADTSKPGEVAADTGDWHQPFAKATRRGDDPPADAQRPPDATFTGKPTAKIYSDVKANWDAIRFTTADGRLIQYTATIQTDFGVIEMELKPEWAPNHVRNFVALARAGYYDGLRIDRIRHEESDQDPALRLDQIEAGCPLGTGEPGYGSVGYWLNPEFNKEVSHEPGVVGACHDAEPDSAACKFYITLSKAPYLDGNYTAFGKVTRGLDVARKIFEQPIILEDRDVDGNRRPEKPIVLQKVTIATREAEGK